MKRGIFIFLWMSLCSITVKAQVPTWSVIPSNYPYSMNVTTKVSVNCTVLQNPSNMVAAFVGTECRGVNYTSNIVSGNYLAFLTAYSNSTSGETMTFKIYDATLDSVYDAATTVQFQDGAAYGFPITPFEIKTNNQPTDISLNSISVNENDTNATVGRLTSTDVDVADVFSYALVAGAGDTDNGSFIIVGDSLFVSGALDFETKSTYSIRIETNDGSCTFEKQFTISVTDVNDAPTGIIIDVTSIDENQVIGTTIGTFTSNDQDSNDTHQYSLVIGAGDIDNASFIIVGDLLKTTAVFNFEVQDTFYIRVKTVDAQGLSFENAFIITVNDLNDAPTDILVSTNTFMENLSLGTPILNFSAADEDTLDIHTFVFDNSQSSDNALFSIVGTDLRTNAMFDFETNSYYTIRVTAFDLSGANFTKQIILNVTDSNDAPTNLLLSNASVFENSPIGTYVGLLSSVDQDAVDSYTYSLVAGAGDVDNASFTISNDSVFTNTLFNYNAQNRYYIRMKTNDSGGLSFENQFTIYIKNSNDPPTNITLSDSTIFENLSIGSLIGLMTTADVDSGDGHFYTLVAGAGDTDNNLFAINGTELLSNTMFDFEAQDTFSIRLQTTDFFGATYQKQFFIYILNANDVPTAINLDTDTVSENLALNTIVIMLSTTDQDTADAHTYSFDNTQVNDNASFIIVGNEIRVNSTINYEVKNIYYISLITNDGNGGTYTSQKIIYIRDENDAPSAQSLSNNIVAENNYPNTFIGLFTTTDEDANDSFIYSLVIGNGDADNVSFSISNDSLFVIDSLDFETKNVYSILVQSTDQGGLTINQQYTINVTNGNDIPTDITIDINEIAENNVALSLVGSFYTTDEDINDVHTYSLVAGNGDADNGSFIITNAGLKLKISSDFETKNTYFIRVKTNDNNGGIFEKEFSINILDINESPISFDTVLYVSENAPLEQIIGTVRFFDQDNNDNHTFRIVNNTVFYMNANEVVLSSTLNYENVFYYSFNVEVKDAAGLVDTAFVEVFVNDEIELNLPLPVNKILSPNGDNKNDLFWIANVAIYSDYSLQIFNNSGFVIYEVSSSYDNSWGGTYNGEVVGQGVYYYLLRSNTDPSLFYKGSISIIR